jgi:DNA-binding transcriptional ArsR family regulator
MLRASEDIYAMQASVLRTLGSPRRLEIVHLLGQGPLEVHRLARLLEIAQPTVSQHLAAMRAAGLVEPLRDGRDVRYRLTDDAIRQACDQMREFLYRRLSRLSLLAAPTHDDHGAQVAPLVAGSRT